MSNSVGTAQLDLGINYKEFNKQLKGISGNAQSMISEAFKGLGKTITAAFATKALFDFGKAAIDLASDLDEVQNVVDVVFGSMADDVNNFAKDALAQFGLSELSAKRFTSTMGAMLKSSGITGDAMLQMSKGITGLAADMASFYNLNPEEAFAKLRAGISGETEPLKQLGINMSVANMEAYALSKGITKSYQSMSQAEQTMLRYNYLLNATKDAQGDFARTSDSWANQVRLLGEQWKIFQTTMGQGFINILTPVVKLLNILIQKLQVAAQYFKAFTDMVFGAKKTTEKAISPIVDMGDATGNMASEVKKAGKAAKGSLASFDQLNVLVQGTADAMGDAAGGMDSGLLDMGGGATVPTVEVDTTQFNPVLDFLNKIKEVTGELIGYLFDAFGPPLRDALNQVLPQLAAWKDTLFNTFSQISVMGAPLKNWFLNDLVPFWQQEILVLGNIFSGLLDTGRKVFEGLRDAAMPILEWFVANGLPLITDFASGALTIYNDLFNGVKFIFDTIWDGAVKPGLDVLSYMIVGVLDSIKAFWDQWGGRIVQGFRDTIKSITDTFQNWWNTIFKPLWDTIVQTVKWLWDNHLKGLVDEFLVFIGKLITGAQEIYNKFILPLINWFIKEFGPSISNAFQLVASRVGTVFGAIADVVKGILKTLGGLIDFIVGVFTGNWSKAWDGIKNVFAGIWDAIVGILKGAVNLIIDSINWMIRGLNKISIDVPNWVSDILGMSRGSKFGFNIDEIPKLANGGYVAANTPRLAIIGDNKREGEIVAPESKIAEAVASAMSMFIGEFASILSDSGSDQPINIYIGNEKLESFIVSANNRRALRNGGRV